MSSVLLLLGRQSLFLSPFGSRNLGFVLCGEGGRVNEAVKEEGKKGKQKKKWVFKVLFLHCSEEIKRNG